VCAEIAAYTILPLECHLNSVCIRYEVFRETVCVAPLYAEIL